MTPNENGFIPEATIVEIMESMVVPSAQALWDAVAVTVTLDGTIEKKPETDEDWETLRWRAVTLAEATNNLVIPQRAVDEPGVVSEYPDVELNPDEIDKLIEQNWPAWISYAHVLHGTAMQAVKAIDARDSDALLMIGGTIDAACESCHLQFWYPEQQ